MDTPEITASVAQGIKCPRCWHYHGVRENHDGLCDRCCLVMMQDFPQHEETPAITAKWQAQQSKYLRKGDTQCSPT